MSFITNYDHAWKRFFLVLIILGSFLLHCYDIQSIPYGYLADADYQYYSLTLYHHILMQAGHPTTIFTPYGFFAVASNMPWNVILKLNAYLLNVVGVDNFWLPRLESIIAWHIAGLFLFFTCRRFFSFYASLFALLVFFFTQNAFLFSRNYMPELIMMMLASMAFYFTVCWFQSKKTHFYVLSVLFSFLAIYFLPKCFFIIMGIYGGFGMGYFGFKNILKEPKTYLFALACIAPMIIYYLTGWGKGNHDGRVMVWELLTRGYFWQGWYGRIKHMATSFFVPLTFLFFVIPIEKKIKLGILFMLLGYLAYGFLFTYHIYTHNYYSIQLFLVFVIMLAAGFDWASKCIKIESFPKYALIVLAGYILFHWTKTDANLLNKNNVEAKLLEVKHNIIARYMTKKFNNSNIISFHFDGLLYYALSQNVRVYEMPEYGNYVGEKAVGEHKNETFSEYTEKLIDGEIKLGAQYFVINDLQRYESQPNLRNILQKYKMTKYNLPEIGSYILVYDLKNKIS